MGFAALARCIGVVLVLVGCGAHTRTTPEAQNDRDAGVLPDGGALPSDVSRWVKALEGRSARLLGRPDGSVVVVTTTSRETRLRAFAPDGEESWSRSYEAPLNLPWDAPEIAIGPNDETYLSLNVSSEQGGALGVEPADCSSGCSIVASFDAAGELLWSTARPAAQSRFLAALEDGVVVATIDLNTPPALTRLSSAGAVAWQQPWPFNDFWPAIMDGGAFAAGDGAGGFYLASSTRGTSGTTCGVITRYDAEDGIESWHGEHCDESSTNVSFSNVVALRDGAVAVLATAMNERVVLSFAGSSVARSTTRLAQAARLMPFDGETLLAIAAQSGPVTAIDDVGRAQWQWPGQLDDGAPTDHPSGLCQGHAAMAPDGELYVLTRACAAARALLGSPFADGEALDPDAWLLARLRLDRDGAGAPRCGNGWLDPGEDCDGEDFAIPGDVRDGLPRPVLCSSWSPGAGSTGAPLCTSACDVDLSSCETTCGNGQLDEGEGCDGELFRNAQSCDEAGLGSGRLGCNDCEVDLSVCPMRASCGNGQLEDWETCDGDLSREPRSCEEIGGSSSALIGCSEDCREPDYTPCEL